MRVATFKEGTSISTELQNTIGVIVVEQSSQEKVQRISIKVE